MLFIKFFVFLLNLKINLTLFHLVYLGNILQGNVVVYPSYYINQNFNSNNASQGCGLSPTLKISQSIIKILAENPNIGKILTIHHTPIRDHHPDFRKFKNRCLVSENHIQITTDTESSLVEACGSNNKWKKFKRAVAEVK